MAQLDFDTAFKALTGMTKPEEGPFPWQQALYRDWFSQGKVPESCNLPTGLGKTSVIAVWLIALANGCAVPRRLVYVVNRRTVVDQTTDEVEKYRHNLKAAKISEPLAISTLRGQYADNREWSADPSRPAVICGTVDMIGSRLLFSGYGCGFKTRPLHAGFLGQDALIVHDEAHLEPAFQRLIEAIRDEQKREPAPLGEWTRLKVMELTATSRAGVVNPFELTDDDKANAEVQKRINATKRLELHEEDEKKLAEKIAAKALDCGKRYPGSAVIVFVRTVKDVKAVTKKLPERTFEELTGTIRGYERDRLVTQPIFRRFLPKAESDGKTVYLVCTSAGEVGVNISADHLVCDLSTFESMAQRFGRVNRFGERTDTEIHVIHPKKFDEKDAFYTPLNLTLGLLELLNGDASPSALTALREKAIKEGSSTEPASSDRVRALRDYINAHRDADPRLGGFAPQPAILPTSDILFDAWALTTMRDLPGRPPVNDYLHGVEDEKRRETQVAWREEVDRFAQTAVAEKDVGELLDEFPLKARELLRDSTNRVRDELAELAAGHEGEPVWVVDPDDTVHVLTLGKLTAEDKKGPAVNLSGRTVVLPPSVGGLTASGTLDGTAEHDPAREYDVAGSSGLASGVPLVRLLVTLAEGTLTYKPLVPLHGLKGKFELQLDEGVKRSKEAKEIRAKCIEVGLQPMRVAFRLDLRGEEETDGSVEYLVLKAEKSPKEPHYKAAWPALQEHLDGVKRTAEEICSRLALPEHVAQAAVLAAEWHDLGKDRAVWQRGAGNERRDVGSVAKTLHGRPPENLNGFRHELASLVDVRFDPAYQAAFGAQTSPCQELLLHLIATHHGRGRPHFAATEATDPERPAEASAQIARETPQRFARLQREYGRWGLAYLESLLRAADAIDSKRIEETPIGDPEPGSWPRPVPPGVVWSSARAAPTPSISVNVDPTNPGQFFACCGLLELADRLWSGAEGWFVGGQFHVTCAGSLDALLRAAQAMQSADEEKGNEGADDDDESVSPLTIIRPIQLPLDWWANKGLKTWAGSMKAPDIFRAMCAAIDPSNAAPFNQRRVVNDPVPQAGGKKRTAKPKKREPFYFDAQRGANALALDIGFVPDVHDMKTEAAPAVEALCLIGLQRCRPLPTGTPRVFDYYTWAIPCGTAVLPVAVCGMLGDTKARGYRFENGFRTSQRKHKAFFPARPIGDSDE